MYKYKNKAMILNSIQKQRIKILYIMLFFLTNSSCKKEDKNSNINNTIYGKWTSVKLKGIYWNAANVPEYDSVSMGNNSYSDFRIDGKIYSYTDVTYNGPVLRVNPKYDTTSFILQGKDTIIITDRKGNNSLFLVQNFTSHSTTLYLSGSIGFGRYENWAYYTR